MSRDLPAAPRVVAHRGASKAARENTIEAFQLAKTLGATMVELDVRATADGELVVHHDPAVVARAHRPGLGRGRTPICELPRDDLPVHIPLLVDALLTCDRLGLGVNVEIKSDPDEPDFRADRAIARQTLGLLEQHRFSVELLISSFDRELIDIVRQEADHLATGFLFSSPGRPVDRFLAGLAKGGHAAIHPRRTCVDELLVAIAHEYGLEVNVWTVDRPVEMRRLRSLGVDAVITNVPDVAVATFAHGEDPG